jgi:hypothetical protein
LKKTNDYSSIDRSLQYALTCVVNDIIIITKLRNNVRNIKINNNVTHEKIDGNEYPKLIDIKNIVGPTKINNDTSERLRPSAIASLSPFFVKFQIFNIKTPKRKDIIEPPRDIIKHQFTNDWSAIELESAGKIPFIRKIKEKIESKKNIPLKNKYSFSNFEIIFGLSSILSSLYNKYYFNGINIFGRLSVIETVSMFSPIGRICF